MKRLTAAARTLAAGDLTQRVDVGGPGEVASLGEAFNEMADHTRYRSQLVADLQELSAAEAGQVMRNLPANAQRHTEAAAMTVTCSAASGMARLEVRDNGGAVVGFEVPLRP
ncbi:MAG: HAMP domain-containing protein [Actinomycetia bacterium]|nr:HAMP domain-containing protein [Actinomycetes bacterium]